MELGSLEFLNVTAATVQAIALGLLLAVVNKAIVGYLTEPVRKKYPNVDLWWLQYVSLVTGFAIAWFAPANLFVELVPSALVGRILSGALVGGGASLIHDVFDKGH